MRNMVEYDQENHISGFDPSVNALRCGVCGGKFKLFEKLQVSACEWNIAIDVGPEPMLSSETLPHSS